MNTTFGFKKASKIQTQADIVFCVDSSGSMDPCIDGLKSEINTFIEGLQSAAIVDFRLRLISYRDLHDSTSPGPPWIMTPFTSSIKEFSEALSTITADGGGDHRGAESTLDALYFAIHSEWRLGKTHKTIVLFTDDNTHPTLHSSTYNLPDNTVNRVIQDLQTLRHSMLFMVLPDYATYKMIEQSAIDADRKIIARYVPQNDEQYIGLEKVQWGSLLNMIGETVSKTTVVVAQKDE